MKQVYLVNWLENSFIEDKAVKNIDVPFRHLEKFMTYK